MEPIGHLIRCIDNGELDGHFELLYGKNEAELKNQKERYKEAITEFVLQFGETIENESKITLFSVPGRSEVGGNHTDHNHGNVLACAVDLDIIAVACISDSHTIQIKSEGFDTVIVDIRELAPKESECYSSGALVRGICARLRELGYDIGSGFNAYIASKVPKGAGLSSSAAFEVMVADIISHLYNSGKIDPVTMAQVSQYAESVYFGKPCGLMDQTACSVGGFITIDFAHPEKPVIEKLNFSFASTGCALCIVDTAGNHANLNEDYASIQEEMRHIARLMGNMLSILEN